MSVMNRLQKTISAILSIWLPHPCYSPKINQVKSRIHWLQHQQINQYTYHQYSSWLSNQSMTININFMVSGHFQGDDATDRIHNSYILPNISDFSLATKHDLGYSNLNDNCYKIKFISSCILCTSTNQALSDTHSCVQKIGLFPLRIRWKGNGICYSSGLASIQ